MGERPVVSDTGWYGAASGFRHELDVAAGRTHVGRGTGT